MSPVVIDMSRADDPRDGVHRAVQALAEGKVVAIPTETVYGLAASALNEKAVDRLLEIKGRKKGHPLALAIKSSDDAMDYVPDMPMLGQRLARRCWPGPVTLVLKDEHPDSIVRQLPASVQTAVSPAKTVGLRVPAHPIALSVLRLTAGPLALTSANRGGGDEAFTAEEVIDALGDDVDMVLDDGRSKFAQPSTVLRVNENNFEILREGVFSEAALRRLSSFIALLVCTGNTCRSPMAEVLAKKKLADKLGCKIDELDDRGVIIASAGIAAMTGGRSSSEAVQVMKQRGLDLTSHESQPLTHRLARHADLILTMTRGHRAAIVAQWPEMSSRVALLCHDGSDVSDPIGGPVELYSRCADQIDAQLDNWLERFDLDCFPESDSK